MKMKFFILEKKWHLFRLFQILLNGDDACVLVDLHGNHCYNGNVQKLSGLLVISAKTNHLFNNFTLKFERNQAHFIFWRCTLAGL